MKKNVKKNKKKKDTPMICKNISSSDCGILAFDKSCSRFRILESICRKVLCTFSKETRLALSTCASSSVKLRHSENFCSIVSTK